MDGDLVNGQPQRRAGEDPRGDRAGALLRHERLFDGNE
jgi:hypothetical protein